MLSSEVSDSRTALCVQLYVWLELCESTDFGSEGKFPESSLCLSPTPVLFGALQPESAVLH